MKRNIRHIVILLLVICIASTVTVSANTVNEQELFDMKTGMTKAEFAAYCDELNANNATTLSIDETYSEADKDELLYLYTMTELSEYEEALNSIGVYIYHSECESDEISTYSDSSDVFLSNVKISYDSTDKTWTLSGGGDWIDTTPLADEVNWFAPSEGDTKNIGGYDAIGVVLHSTSGTIPTQVSCKAKIGDGTGNFTYMYNPSTFDSAGGVAFLYQDYLICTEGGLFSYEWAFHGQQFYAEVTYDSTFSNYNGKARMFYAHTWNKNSVSSVQFGVGEGMLEMQISFSKEENYFTSYSTGDKVF